MKMFPYPGGVTYIVQKKSHKIAARHPESLITSFNYNAYILKVKF
jgi:hypothetical protein